VQSSSLSGRSGIDPSQPWILRLVPRLDRVEAELTEPTRIYDALIGAAVVAVIDNGMGLLGYSAGIKLMITGGVLMLAAGADALSRKRSAAKAPSSAKALISKPAWIQRWRVIAPTAALPPRSGPACICGAVSGPVACHPDSVAPSRRQPTCSTPCAGG
jgi:small neutral amino acid transporter SnatA (MarC family)